MTVEVDRKNHLLSFVHISHFPQKRKYTNEQYTIHLRSVAEMAQRYKVEYGYEIGLCHDLLEDTNIDKSTLFHALLRFGYDYSEANFISDSVLELTDKFTHEAYPSLNRKERKKLECERMANISQNSQSVKYCDLIDNTSSILKHDPSFAKVYLKEKFDLLQVMDKGNNELFNMALKNVTA